MFIYTDCDWFFIRAWNKFDRKLISCQLFLCSILVLAYKTLFAWLKTSLREETEDDLLAALFGRIFLFALVVFTDNDTYFDFVLYNRMFKKGSWTVRFRRNNN